MPISSLFNTAMTEQMHNLLLVDQPIRIPRVHIPVTAEERFANFAREVASMKAEYDTLLKQKALDLAKGTDTTIEAVDAFRRAEASDHQTAREAYKKAFLTPEQEDTFTAICKDGLREGQKPSPGDKEVYSQLLQNPDSLKNAKTTHVQDDDTFEALTSPQKSKSDAAFERLTARFRMNPDIEPNDAVLTIANTLKNAERKGQVGSLVSNKK